MYRMGMVRFAGIGRGAEGEQSTRTLVPSAKSSNVQEESELSMMGNRMAAMGSLWERRVDRSMSQHYEIKWLASKRGN